MIILLRLFIWDCTEYVGQERFGALYRIYYRDALGAFLVFDLSKPETFQSVLRVSFSCITIFNSNSLIVFIFSLQWKRDIDQKVVLPDGSPLPVVLLANKCDLPYPAVKTSQLDSFCQEHGFAGWVETSAKMNINVEEAIRGLVSHILKNTGVVEAHRVQEQIDRPASKQTLSLTDPVTNKDSSNSGCC